MNSAEDYGFPFWIPDTMRWTIHTDTSGRPATLALEQRSQDGWHPVDSRDVTSSPDLESLGAVATQMWDSFRDAR